MKANSDQITDGIRVQVYPEYLESESQPGDGKFLFAYTIIIRNEGDEWAKLLTRHWKIIDSEGYLEEVRGAGVVGYTPELEPGEQFKYTSFCPLSTPWGTMEGTFQMIRRDGTEFDAEVGRFYLFSPLAAEMAGS